MDEHLINLCRDYIELVTANDEPSLTYDERHAIEQQRVTVHRQLCQHTDKGYDIDMVRYAKNILYAARAGTLMTERHIEREWVKSHRAIGYIVGNGVTNDGIDVAILQTSENQQTVAPVFKLLPVKAQDRAFEARMAVLEALQRALFLDVEPDALQQMFAEEFNRLLAERDEQTLH